jgi:hypothetical protein
MHFKRGGGIGLFTGKEMLKINTSTGAHISTRISDDKYFNPSVP